MNSIDDALSFYKKNYDVCWLILEAGNKIFLGNRDNRVCRFCDKSPPEVSFRDEAHAIPESLGNKSLFSLYECDSCNKFFGNGIENDFGNWSKPMRTLGRIKGKTGVPIIKNEKDGWRFEWDNDNHFKINHDRGDPVFTVDKDEKRVTFQLKRDVYRPIAVLKAFVKMGLSLMPDAEMPNFAKAIEWIRNPNHGDDIEIMAPVHQVFTPGPAPLNISVAVMRRKAESTGVPYAFFILTFGNETFQVKLPSPERDQTLSRQPSSLLPFPGLRTQYGSPLYYSIDLTGRERVVGDIVSADMTFEKVEESGIG